MMAIQASSALPSSNGGRKPSDYKYLVGVYNKQQRNVTLVEAPFFEPQMRPKRLIDSEDFGRITTKNYAEAKKDLALAFGTRKKKSAITSMERNQVDYAALGSSSAIIQKMVADAKDEDAKDADGKPRRDLANLQSSPNRAWRLCFLLTTRSRPCPT